MSEAWVSRAASGLSHAVVSGTTTTFCGRSVYDDEVLTPTPLCAPCSDCIAGGARQERGA